MDKLPKTTALKDKLEAIIRKSSVTPLYSAQYVDYPKGTWTVAVKLLQKRIDAMDDWSITRVRVIYHDGTEEIIENQ